MQEVLTARAALRAALSALVVAASGPAASAITLGEVEVRSVIGEALDARIPVAAGPGEQLRGACFSFAPDAASELPAPVGATLELSGGRLRVRTKEPVQDPALTLGILIVCPGSDAATRRDYSILLDPPRVARATPSATTAVATLAARPGDTLQSLATQVFPREARARRAYLAAMRAQNPALADLSDTDPLPEDAQVALPDLRTFMRAAPAARSELAVAKRAAAAPAAAAPAAAVPAAAVPPAPRPKPSRAADEPPAPRERPKARAAEQAPTQAAAAGEAPPTAPRAGFRLKLSAPVVDLAPSRAMDERQRAALRARLTVLDSDDQTAAMLALQDSIRRLESRVSELQLRLASLPPPAAPATRAETPPAPPSEPATPPPSVEAKPATSVEPRPTASAEPKPEAAKAEPPAAAPSSEVERAPPTAAHAVPRPAYAKPWYESEWMWPGVLAGLALLLAVWVIVRRRAAGASFDEEPWEVAPEDGGAQTVMMVDDAPAYREASLPGEVVAEHDADALLATTRIPSEDNADLRRRYLEERFPEIVNGTLVLSDPASVVNAARLMHEDGAAPRAIELLQLAIERDPRPLAPWLALFEVFRRERLRADYAALGVRFMERHAATLEWRKVRYVGRELDPGNPLYEDTEPALSFDPAAERWLEASAAAGDATLAAELRGGLMAGAALNEHDLVPDPTPALRKSESLDLA